MPTQTIPKWKPGTDLPYAVPLGNGSMLAIKLDASWVKLDRSGEPLLLPPALRAIDRLRAVFAAQERLTPGFVASLREALGLTQSEFGQRLGVSKMTVSRWECGRMRPGPAATRTLFKLRSEAQREGVFVGGEATHRARAAG